MDEPPEVDFIQLSSYGLKGTAGAGKVEVCLSPRSDLRGRHVVIVEDIVDSGETLRFLRDFVTQRQPASVRVCALLLREKARRQRRRPRRLRWLRSRRRLARRLRPRPLREVPALARPPHRRGHAVSLPAGRRGLAGLIAVARGDAPGDLLFTNGRVVNTLTAEIEETDVVVFDGRIAGLGSGYQGARDGRPGRRLPLARLHQRAHPRRKLPPLDNGVRPRRRVARHCRRRHRPARDRERRRSRRRARRPSRRGRLAARPPSHGAIMRPCYDAGDVWRSPGAGRNTAGSGARRRHRHR